MIDNITSAFDITLALYESSCNSIFGLNYETCDETKLQIITFPSLMSFQLDCFNYMIHRCHLIIVQMKIDLKFGSLDYDNLFSVLFVLIFRSLHNLRQT